MRAIQKVKLVYYFQLFLTCFILCNIVKGENISKLPIIFLNSDTINIKSFGVVGNGLDETVNIQKALNSATGKVLFIPKQQGKYYLSGQLLVPSNIVVVFEKGVIFKALNTLKQDISNFEVLFRFQNSKNVSFFGNNARFFMEKNYYTKEFNHLFMINGATNINLYNIRAESAGGDGFYIGAVRTSKTYSENIKVINCISSNNRRQGMSITSVQNFYAENCEFSNTSGTLPEAGVDIEPSQPSHILKKIKFVKCRANGNRGAGFLVALFKLNQHSSSIDISFEDCQANNNQVGFWNKYFSEGSKGLVSFVNCKSIGSKEYGFGEGSCSSSGAAKLYRNCVAENNNVGNQDFSRYSAFAISNLSKMKKKSLGNSTFINCQAISNQSNTRMDYGITIVDNVPFQNVIIKNFSSKGHVKRDINVATKSLSSRGSVSIVK